MRRLPAGTFRFPVSIVTCYLREMNFTPEKSDFYNFTLLVSPSSDATQLTRLMHALEQLERALAQGDWVSDVLPSLASSGQGYANISLRELCCVINHLFKHHQIQQLQSNIFSSVAATQAVMTPHAANQAFVRGRSRLIDIADAVGCVAAEGVIPYPARGGVHRSRGVLEFGVGGHSGRASLGQSLSRPCSSYPRGCTTANTMTVLWPCRSMYLMT